MVYLGYMCLEEVASDNTVLLILVIIIFNRKAGLLWIMEMEQLRMTSGIIKSYASRRSL